MSTFAVTLTPEQYMDLLKQRREAYYAEYGQPHPGRPALIEWFIEDGDEQLVDRAAIDADLAAADRASRRTAPTPRAHRTAASIRAELDRVEARLAAIEGTRRHDTDDLAAYGGIGIRQTGRQRRKHGERLDRLAQEHTRLTRKRDVLRGRLAVAAAREVDQ